jgi:hypothetical protein
LPLWFIGRGGAFPWSPLARGRLTQPWSDKPPTARAESDTYARSLFARTAAIDKPIVERLHGVAQKRGIPSSQIALAWMLSKPAITPTQARNHSNNCRCHKNGTSRRRSRSSFGHALERRNRPARKTLSTAFPCGSHVLRGAEVGLGTAGETRERRRVFAGQFLSAAGRVGILLASPGRGGGADARRGGTVRRLSSAVAQGRECR